MQERSKLTNNTDETELEGLISGDIIFTVPYFQRAYKWKPDKIKQLNSDVLRIVDETDLHFLGAVIVHGRRTNPSEPTPFDIIDGQQRITTIILYLCAVVKQLCQVKEFSTAKNLFLKYLVIGRDTSLTANIKLIPCKEDRTQLNSIYEGLIGIKNFKKELGGFNLKLPPAAGKSKGPLINNYRAISRFLKEQFDTAGIDRITDIYTAILEAMSVVQIDVYDPTNGPKIFDALNSRQEPMTIGDLVRNEIFSRVATKPQADIEQIDEHKWQPFYNKFKNINTNLFDAYFFPYGLIKNQNIKKSEVYNYLRDSWEHISDPVNIIEELEIFQTAFIDLVSGTNLQCHDKDIELSFNNLTRAKIPTSTYSFLVQLSNSIVEKKTNKKDALETLACVESFLVRRALCGFEPTGLHAVFKRLWVDCGGAATKSKVISAIKKHKTVAWPDNADVKQAIVKRSLYNSAITPYFLVQYDKSLAGDYPDTMPWIEHVLPTTMSPAWQKDFNKDQHDDLKDTLANLIPLTKEMNIKVGNKGYKEKMKVYEKDSSFKSAREFAKNNTMWTPVDIQSRAVELGDWAVKHWKY
ncbi:MAG: DUF262 domain-containing protein [Pseudohongiellaceae bacterium]